MRNSILRSARAPRPVEKVPTRLSFLPFSLSDGLLYLLHTSRINWPQAHRVGYLESNAVSPEALASKRLGDVKLVQNQSEASSTVPEIPPSRYVILATAKSKMLRSRRGARGEKKKNIDGFAKRSDRLSYPDCDFECNSSRKKKSLSGFSIGPAN